MNTTVPMEVKAYFATIDYSILAMTLLASLAIGIYIGFFGKKLATMEDYLVGGRQMKVLPIAISLVASQTSVFSIMTIPAEVYSFGWQFAMIVPASLLVILTTNYISLPVFYHNNIENCFVYLELRFGKATRKILTILYLGFSFFTFPVAMYIPAIAFAEVTKLDAQTVNIVVWYICIVYTMLGGIKAVVWTDVLQAGVMITSIVMVAYFGVRQSGGLEEVWHRAVAGGRIFPPIMTMDLTTRVTLWNSITSSYFLLTCHVSFHQTCVQRLVSLPSLEKAKRAMLVFFIGMVFAMSLNCATGIIMYAFYHGCDPVKANIVTKYDKLMPRFVADVAGHIPGMSGIFISCVFSASLSGISAGLHAVSGVIYSDCIRPLKLFTHTDANANRTMKIIIFTLGTACAFSGSFFDRFQSIFQVMYTVSATTNGAKFGAFTLGLLYPWANQKGLLSGIFIGTSVVLMIVLNAQYHIARGFLRYDVVETSVEKCSNETIAYIQPSIYQTHNEVDDEFAFYKISFQWYATIGVLMTWIPAVIISHLTGGQDLNKFNIQLLSPFVQKLLPKKYRHIELKTIEREKL